MSGDERSKKSAFGCVVGLVVTQIGEAVSVSKPNTHTYPAAGAEYLRTSLGERQLYNDYEWGGYMIYELFPQVPLFVDGRSDFYRSRIMEDYANIGTLQPGWEELIRQYGIEAVLLRKNSRLARKLRENSGWQEVFTGDVESVLVRVPGTANP